MIIKGIVEEDFLQYRKPSMVIMMPRCDWKCGKGICQNSPLAQANCIIVNPTRLVNRYVQNDITKAIVFSGLEPMLDFEEMFTAIEDFRRVTDDDIVIYTGYEKDEVIDKIQKMCGKFKNIYIKFGRFIPNHPPHFDKVLGVSLASDNQYGEKLC